ncbi:hypothetical protein CAL29_24990 [Bordetella genomosp. 10]|uniref:ACT domain-containing protein n=1 Tax=Bordetella genomosp. 10 TaxID=1416804 RepID=A0A261S1H4_9BORD|nr:hypothetical protein [Bordetella genomosp. 10]OZI31189.1 hypothetical protein CAL29_24990 [Bordetella genomosp. 10]
MLQLAPTRRAPAAPAFLNVTFYGAAGDLAIIRKRLYLALQTRPETVAEVRYSVDGVQASTMVRLRSNNGDISSLLGWLGALCRELRVHALHAAPAGSACLVHVTTGTRAERAARVPARG